MIVKDYYIVDDLEHLIINDIIKYLIKNNINYLYIKESKELHFDNYILRFKSNKNLKELLFDDFLKIINNIYDSNYTDYFYYKDFLIDDNTFKKNNFKYIKNINNTEINTKSKTKVLKKQLNPTRKIYK